MKKVLAISGVELRRMLRDRSNIFFVFIFPFVLVLLIGIQFGGSFDPHLALYEPDGAGPLADDLVQRVEDADIFVVDRVDSEQAAVDAVARGAASAGLVVPAGYDQALRGGNERVEVGYVTRQDGSGLSLQAAVGRAVAEQAALVRAARFAVDEQGGGFDQALARAEQLAPSVPDVEVEVTRVGEAQLAEFENLGQFDLGASSQLLLFVFLTSLAGSASLIQTRQWGVTTRMLSTPTRSWQVLGGQAGGRLSVALVQALYIALGTALLFGVSWGDPIGAAAVVLLFSLVSTGAAMLLGAVFSNDAQAGGMGIFIGLGLAALGGSMAPLEVFPETMQRIAKLTPHAWANEAFAELVRRDGGIADILPELGVLAAMAAGLLALASWRLHRVTVER